MSHKVDFVVGVFVAVVVVDVVDVVDVVGCLASEDERSRHN